MMTETARPDSQIRFQQAMVKFRDIYPHCDTGITSAKLREPDHSNGTKFPGGAIRRVFGFDISQFIMDMLRKVESKATSAAPQAQLSLMMSMMLVKGMVQGISAAVTEMVPPLIPPPFWILQPLPCLPMLLGSCVTYAVFWSCVYYTLRI